jgi:hypothetical protein
MSWDGHFLFHKDWTICDLACEMDLVSGISKFYFSTEQLSKSTFHRISSLESDRIFYNNFFFMLNFEIHWHHLPPNPSSTTVVDRRSLYCLKHPDLASRVWEISFKHFNGFKKFFLQQKCVTTSKTFLSIMMGFPFWMEQILFFFSPLFFYSLRY